MERMREPQSMLFGALIRQPISGDAPGGMIGGRSHLARLFVCMAVASLVIAALV